MMHITATNAKSMLNAMGYSCEALDHIVQVPEPAIVALRSVWQSVQKGQLQRWEVELIHTRMLEAVMQPVSPAPSARASRKF